METAAPNAAPNAAPAPASTPLPAAETAPPPTEGTSTTPQRPREEANDALRRLAVQVEQLRQQILLRMLVPPSAEQLPEAGPPREDGAAAAQRVAAVVAGPRVLLIAYGGFINGAAWPIMAVSFADPLPGETMQTAPTGANAPAGGVTLTGTAAATTLQDGQAVRATVLSTEGGQVSLRIGNQILQLQTPIPLQQGQQLDLQVERLRDLLVLRLMNTPRLADLVSTGIRQALPQQGGLPPLLANLQALARGELPMPTPREFNQLAERFLQQLPELRNLVTEQGVRQAIQESGVFLEAKLAQAVRSGAGEATSAALQNDLKTALLKLLTGLRSLDPGSTGRESGPRPPTTPAPPADPGGTHRPPPPLPNAPLRAQPPAQPSLATADDLQQLRSELVKQTQSALARVQLGQLSSVRTDADANQQWMLEIPVRNGESVDMVQVRIESRGAKRARKGAKSWSVSLALDLGKLGPMEARVTLGEDESVSTLFWSEREEATTAIERNLPLLQRNFNDCGLKVGRLAARTGEPPAADQPAIPMKLNLLDLKA
ncbi:flagellar hook-length control protein FliK [Endothiovibrio diazotrophicus]